jgi:hypothetical protein
MENGSELGPIATTIKATLDAQIPTLATGSVEAFEEFAGTVGGCLLLLGRILDAQGFDLSGVGLSVS